MKVAFQSEPEPSPAIVVDCPLVCDTELDELQYDEEIGVKEMLTTA